MFVCAFVVCKHPITGFLTLWPTNILRRQSFFQCNNASNFEYPLESYKDTYSNDRGLLLFVTLQKKKKKKKKKVGKWFLYITHVFKMYCNNY